MRWIYLLFILCLCLLSISNPAAAADTYRLLYVTSDLAAYRYDILAVDTDTGKTTSIFTIESTVSDIIPRDAQFVLSPDGRYLAYVLIWQSASDYNKSEARYYILNLQTLEQLSIDVLGATTRSATSFYPILPSWSPDGTRLAVATSTGEFGIFNLADLSLIVLQREPTPASTLLSLAPGAGPLWSSDGLLLAYTPRTRYSDLVYIIPSDGSGPPIPLITEDPDQFVLHHLMGWVPDRHEVVIDRSTPYDTDAGQKILRVNTDTQETQLLGQASPYAVSDVLGTGKILIDDFSTIRAVDVITGETHPPIKTVGILGTSQVTPDQRHILTFEVIEQNTTIREYHMETGEQTATFSIPYPISSLYWTPDQQDMIFQTTNPKVLTTNLYRIKADASDSPQYLTTVDGTQIGWANLNLT